jgi:Rho guanine nucleotide exchange factor 7
MSRLTKDEYKLLVSNIKEVVSLHENILSGLETITGRPPGDQRVGKMFLSMAPKIKQIHHTYCAGHPRAVSVINKHK